MTLAFRDTPTGRVYLAQGGLVYRLSELISHCSMALHGSGSVLMAERALEDIAAARTLLNEMEAALLAGKAEAETKEAA
jgi:uncharacterized membrane protein